jgi:hypothetical protein
MALPLSAGLFYTPLPPGNHIRLLEIKTEHGKLPDSCNGHNSFNREDVLVVQLHVANLNVPPLYDALSYTWGNPLTVFGKKKDWEQAEKKYSSKVPIMCNGRLLYINLSLYEALSALRQTKRWHSALGITSQDLSSSRLVVKPLVRNRIWIDAVCIDQSNLEERSSQVKMMHLIYKNADAVLIWLGPQDKVAMQAVTAMDKLLKAPKLATKTLRLSEKDRSTAYQAAMRLPIHEFDWYCIVSLLQRRWFRRAWVIQEVAWARTAIVVCGSSLWLEWRALLLVSDWMMENIKDIDVWMMPWIKRSSTVFETSGYSKKRSDNLINHTIRSMGNVRFEIRKDDPALHVKEGVKNSSLLELLVRFWESECSDPRDKVYALLSLCRDQTVLQSVPVDYSKSVAEVYTETAREILRSMGNLDLLSYSLKNRNSGSLLLPSWVPDWSTKPDSIPISYDKWMGGVELNGHLVFPFCADGNTGEWTAPVWSGRSFNSSNGQCLIIHGKRVSSIKTTAPLNIDEPDNMFLVLNDIPSIYSYFKSVPKQSAADMMKNSHRPWARTDETRFEAMWRTVIGDTWKSCHPAPDEGGFAFVRFLTSELNRTTSELVSRSQSTAKAVDDNSKLKLKRKKASLESILRSLSEDEKRCLDRYNGDSNDNSHRGTPAEDCLIVPPRRYLPHIEPSNDISDLIASLDVRDGDDSVNFRRHFGQSLLLFSTEDHKLGLGSSFTRRGDQIWIVNGAKYPFVLRQRGDGTFELVGAAYVHGIMHGQAVGISHGVALPFPVDNTDLADIVLK